MKNLMGMTVVWTALLLPFESGLLWAGMPAVGESAPAFSGKDQDGKKWQGSDFSGAKVVLLYFYPKDNTPGCTAEACGWRDRMGDLKKDNVEVIGVSFDSPESHRKFIEDHKLNFPLLADTDGKIAHVTDNPNAAIHLEEMQKAIARLRKK